MLHVQESGPCKTDPYMDQYDPADKGKPFVVSLLFDIVLPMQCIHAQHTKAKTTDSDQTQHGTTDLHIMFASTGAAPVIKTLAPHIPMHKCKARTKDATDAAYAA